MTRVEVVGGADQAPSTLPDALARLAEAQDTLRAIGAGEVDAFVITDGDVGRRVFTLATADRPYRMFVENMQDGAATVSADGLIVYANRRLAELLSYPRETIVGSPLARFLASDVPTGFADVRDGGPFGVNLEIDLVDAHGRAVPVLAGTVRLEVDGDQLACVTFADLSAQKAQDREIARLGAEQAERMADLQEAQAALTQQATHDMLTGLPNRVLLIDRIDQALLQAARSGLCVAVIFVDLDRFKLVNDTHGHAAGDSTLRKTAKRLLATLRDMDTVARIGGDEFVILAPDIGSHLQAVALGERLVAELGRHADRLGANGRERVAASVGITVSDGGRGTAEILLHEADMAMYKAKSSGGGRAEAFDAGLSREVQQRSKAQRTLEGALDERRVVAYYQPVIDLTDSTLAGFEALARIIEPDGIVLPPASFIGLAEESGLVVSLGAQMLELACREAHGWPTRKEPQRGLTVAVNLSSRQFEPGDLPTVVEACLARSGLSPDQLHFELTETTIMALRPDLLGQLNRIRELGVEIGLDDFGTGYASLTHLRRLPLTFVKIDQSFVQGLGADQEDERIVGAVVDLAANLGLRSIAEGVETIDQLDRLRRLGCDQAQGYLFARPLPPNDVLVAIERTVVPPELVA
ncbi:MAG: hypothetical protein JWO68_3953 [Actinomycetia bacterium]|nr:hypothetical protein [Actinomycetes bacterium]